MIRVKIDLISAVDPSRDRELGRLYISNDGTGTEDLSDYDVQVMRKGSETPGNAPGPRGGLSAPGLQRLAPGVAGP